MSIFFLILGVAGTEINPGIKLIKIPITQELETITCDQAFEKNVSWQVNPKFESGNGQIWGYYTHKGKAVFLHYCKDQKDNWVR